ncbi:Thioesterase superfamily [Actinomadura meyerae]|uniref:Thioesterase superfamily n=1 Tax=Actinomadura meyerae TaxID=240840 RepID=A0A239DIN4_9ACTN|nr:hotdog domain-containing protein [Actinomadura meyerae]SNS31573.1 Thioesterase superfamily [Actinomadura meyerae]
MRPGLRGQVSHVVGDEDTAAAVGSGDVPVLATPRLLALAEAATVEAVKGRLGDGRTSVGTRVELEHRAASPVGSRVTVEAELEEVDGTRLVFAVGAVDERGPVAGGRVERVVVERERFLARFG